MSDISQLSLVYTTNRKPHHLNNDSMCYPSTKIWLAMFCQFASSHFLIKMVDINKIYMLFDS